MGFTRIVAVWFCTSGLLRGFVGFQGLSVFRFLEEAELYLLPQGRRLLAVHWSANPQPRFALNFLLKEGTAKTVGNCYLVMYVWRLEVFLALRRRRTGSQHERLLSRRFC